jgi:hypothetical protein
MELVETNNCTKKEGRETHCKGRGRGYGDKEEISIIGSSCAEMVSNSPGWESIVDRGRIHPLLETAAVWFALERTGKRLPETERSHWTKTHMWDEIPESYSLSRVQWFFAQARGPLLFLHKDSSMLRKSLGYSTFIHLQAEHAHMEGNVVVRIDLNLSLISMKHVMPTRIAHRLR